MSEMKAWNDQIIDEFRSNDGQLGGNFEGAPVLLLHTIGAKSGLERINPMMFQDLGDDRVAVFASKAGADSHPDWYRNLVANPGVSAEIGTQTKADYPGFAGYEASTSRLIPVVILDPA